MTNYSPGEGYKKGYQTRMNEILRDAMLKELKNHQ